MKCHEIRDLLPLHLYGDVNDAERAAVDAHVAECSDCRAELAALGAVRKGLDVALPELGGVDVGAIYRAEADRLRGRSRRWRIAAAAAVAAAVVVLASRVDVQADGRQLVVRWGEPSPAAPPIIERTVVVRSEPARTQELEARINRVSTLIEAVVANMDTKDAEQQKELARLRHDLMELRQIKKRLSQTEADVSALYTAQFRSRPSGVNP